VVLLLCSELKSIVGMIPKVNESIKDRFKYETWFGGVHVGLRVRVLNTIAALGM
jgi:hypothetical protein